MTDIALITAFDQNRVIGIDNRLPWQLPNDLKYFKETTLNKPIIMGRTTYDSMGKALPHRRNIVLTRDPHLHLPDAECAHSVDEIFSLIKEEPLAFVIGGAKIYELFLPLATYLYITHVHAEFKGDTYFPSWNHNLWQIVSTEKHYHDDKHACDYTFSVYHKL